MRFEKRWECWPQVTWQWRRFTNPARTDGLELQHWVKCHKELATGTVKPVDGGEYQFAKYNKKARAPTPDTRSLIPNPGASGSIQANANLQQAPCQVSTWHWHVFVL